MDVTELWRPLIPIQVIGMVLLIGLAIFLGYMEQRKICKQYGSTEAAAALEPELDEQEEEHVEQSAKDTSLARPKLLWINVLLAIAVIGVLVWGIIPAGLAFMIGVSIALPINYPNMKDQMDRIKAHAPNALMMATIILAAGSFLGILTGTGMLDRSEERRVGKEGRRGGGRERTTHK